MRRHFPHQVSAILVAAGSGVRLRSRTAKPWIRLGRKPLLKYSLDTLESCGLFDEIILVVHPDALQKAQGLAMGYPKKRIVVAIGGARRALSVLNGFQKVTPASEYVLVHDAARPFVNYVLIERLLKQVRGFDAAVLAIKPSDTIREIDPCTGLSRGTLDRKRLSVVQTPQVFKQKILARVYREIGLKKVEKATDEASLVEMLGGRVRTVEGDPCNIKITTPVDLRWARWWIGQSVK